MSDAPKEQYRTYPGKALLILISWYAGIFFTSAQTAIAPAFDTVHFREMEKDAAWMNEYEAISWYVNDSLEQIKEKPLTRFGQDGCCISRPDNSWLILYRTNNTPSFFLSVDSSGFPTNLLPGGDVTPFQPWLVALRNCSVSMEGTIDSLGIHMDQFIRRRADSTFEIRYFPAFQPSGQGIYGAEWSFIYSPDGSRLLSKNQSISELKGVWIGQPRELYLDYRHLDFPTTGAVYFALFFGDFFTRIHIDTKHYRSTLVKEENRLNHWKHKLKN